VLGEADDITILLFNSFTEAVEALTIAELKSILAIL
jgi:hypothetical protein